MEIILDKVSKRFNQDWLFKDLNYRFCVPLSYAITGPNGSGKTTLLKIISGMMPCTSGKIIYQQSNASVDPDSFYKYISFVAPYMELPEELTLNEFLKFHFGLKPNSEGLSSRDIAVRAALEHALGKPLHTFSSGMKQRVKLALGLFSSTPVLFMDEPTTNLDESGVSWYKDEINRIKSEKLVIISSNQSHEYAFCDHLIQLGGS
jgi:ABC-type multidrug transport system ATPase subunit